MYNGNVQQNSLYTQHSVVSKDLPISPLFSPAIFCRDANSILLQEHLSLYSSNRLYAQNPVLVSGALLWTCSSAEREGLIFTYCVQRECSAEAFMRSFLCH